MQATEAVTMIGGIVGVLAFFGGAVWMVATIRTTTGNLRVSMDRLHDSVDGLCRKIDRLSDKIEAVESRVVRLETVMETTKN